MCKKIGLIALFWFVFSSLAWAEATEVQLPDGRTVLLFDDYTWEFKRPAPHPVQDTVDVEQLVLRPNNFAGQDLVVTGNVVRFLGAYRLQSGSQQNTLVVDVDKVRRADQLALERALAAAGGGNAVRIQVQGEVQRSLTASRLIAEDLLVLK